MIHKFPTPTNLHCYMSFFLWEGRVGPVTVKLGSGHTSITSFCRSELPVSFPLQTSSVSGDVLLHFPRMIPLLQSFNDYRYWNSFVPLPKHSFPGYPSPLRTHLLVPHSQGRHSQGYLQSKLGTKRNKHKIQRRVEGVEYSRNSRPCYTR